MDDPFDPIFPGARYGPTWQFAHGDGSALIDLTMTAQLLHLWLELSLLILSGLAFSLGMGPASKARQSAAATITSVGLLLIMVISFTQVAPLGSAFGGTYVVGPVELIFKQLFLLSGFLVVLLSWPKPAQNALIPTDRLTEYLGLLLLSLTGMCFLVSARELILLYVGLELVTIPLLLLVAFNHHDLRSAEAGLKYVLFAALSSGLLLYGLSLIYGLTGTTLLAGIAARLQVSTLTMLALVLVMAGVGFKVAAVPFHLWTPDTYEGAPMPVAAFLSVASKAAGFVLFFKLISQALAPLASASVWLIALLATLTMTFGNLVALHQTNMKRFLAYSSIAQAGYLLLGLVNTGALGKASVVYYLLVYIVSNLAAFGVISLIASATGKEDMSDYVALSETNPMLALVMMLALFSLAGIPPLAGFLGKFYLFAATAERGLYWLIVVAAVNATLSLYYYLLVIKSMYLVKPTASQIPIGRIPIHWSDRTLLGLTSAGMVIIGIAPQFLKWIESAVQAGF
jgi:NADH-quinone oxidoreductase subunit N